MTDAIDIRSFHEPDSGTWTHLLADRGQRVAAIIDPVWVYDPVSGLADSSFIESVLAAAESAGYRVEWILETHAHADHLTAADLLRRRTGARIACGRGICAVQQTFAAIFNLGDLPCDGRQFDRLLIEGDVIRLGGLDIEVIETPGHTADSVAYRVGDAVFVGDTLFAPGFGTARCDFPGGDAGHLFDSIERIHGLPPHTRIFFCHDYPKAGADPVSHVTVEQSRRDNIHVGDGNSRADFVAMRRARDAQLSLPRLILPSLQVNIRAGAAPQAEANGVAYLKMPFGRPFDELVPEQIPGEEKSTA
jgi:glyoxylase-like metal-dependent hydrolase (beta-lactamase superfamily II)